MFGDGKIDSSDVSSLVAAVGLGIVSAIGAVGNHGVYRTIASYIDDYGFKDWLFDSRLSDPSLVKVYAKNSGRMGEYEAALKDYNEQQEKIKNQ